MNHIETMKQALDALDHFDDVDKTEEAIKALRAAIAQGESEPKKWLSWSDKCGEQAWDTQDEAELNSDEDFEPVPLYTRGVK